MKLVSRRAMVGYRPFSASGRGATRSPKRGAAWRSAHDAAPESLALVNPVVASSEIGENLVANGPHPGGKVVDADALADQGGKIAAARGALGKIADVDRQQ